jgi:hypothetical protein
MMAEFRPTIDSLKLLATMGDPVGADVVGQRVEEFVAFRQDVDQKIENLELFTPRDIMPLAPKARISPARFARIVLEKPKWPRRGAGAIFKPVDRPKLLQA